MGQIILRQVGENRYQLFNGLGGELTNSYYFPSSSDALVWAKNWVSSFYDIDLIVDKT